jgi:PmbA protein
MGWDALEGALSHFQQAGRVSDIIVGGDVTLIRERFAVANSLGVTASEEASYALAFITTMLEGENSKGTGWAVSSDLDAFDPRAAGAEAARSAVDAIGGVGVPDGVYRVVLGPQAMNELLGLFSYYCNLQYLDASSSPFCGKLGDVVVHPALTIEDDPVAAGGIPRRVTSDGYPASRTPLVEAGRFVGILSDFYYSRKSLSGERWKSVGQNRDRVAGALRPWNGYRLSWDRPGRLYESHTGIATTNLALRSEATLSREELLSEVGDGLYIGRLWYTYPMNGEHSGDITGTVVGDSYLIEGGQIGRPLLPNRVRIHANLPKLLSGVLGVGGEPRVTTGWSEFGRTVISPEVAVSGMRCTSISEEAWGPSDGGAL